MKREEGIENRELDIKRKGVYGVGYEIGDEGEGG